MTIHRRRPSVQIPLTGCISRERGFKMADLNDEEQPSNCAERAQSRGSTTELDRVQELTWALIDERISDGEKAWLDEALCCSEEARRTYLRCIQLHTELATHFAAPAPRTGTMPIATTPLLGLPGIGTLPLELQGAPTEVQPID
jgi:hypothetical protein